MAHERYRETTDGRATAYRPSEREREFTFAKIVIVSSLGLSGLDHNYTTSLLENSLI